MATTQGKRSKAAKLDDALVELNHRITELGEEYPDASWQVSQCYGVNYDDLQTAYDNQGN